MSIEKIKRAYRKLFPLKYITWREFYKWLALLFFLVCSFSFIYLLEDIFVYGHWRYDEQICLLGDIIIGWFFFSCWSYKATQILFRKKGKRYEGKIIRAERMIGGGEDTYYLFIEFYKDKKRLVRRTAGYVGSPNFYLENGKCAVYEYLGHFIEADFNVRKELPDRLSYHHIKETKHKMFMPKGDKYV